MSARVASAPRAAAARGTMIIVDESFSKGGSGHVRVVPDTSEDMWQLYLTRVLQPEDVRLKEVPFSESPVQYIVHRHRIRIQQSFQNAVDHCRTHRLRLYVVKAAIEAKV